MIQTLFIFSDWALLALRIILGLILLAHGIPKMKDIAGTAGWLHSLKFKPATFWAWVAAIVEVVGGAFLVLGFFTQVVAFLVVLQFIIVMGKIKKFEKLVDGYEFDLLIAGAAFLLMTMGGGSASIDQALGIFLN